MKTSATKIQTKKFFSNFLTTILAMNPMKSMKEFWMGSSDAFGIDIFQHREDLNGLSFASQLAKVPKEFERIIKGEVHES